MSLRKRTSDVEYTHGLVSGDEDNSDQSYSNIEVEESDDMDPFSSSTTTNTEMRSRDFSMQSELDGSFLKEYDLDLLSTNEDAVSPLSVDDAVS
jgi:hypothetical protein